MKFDKNKIKKLISNSLFLDQERKKKLLKLLQKSNKQECAELSVILKEEKPLFSDLIRNFIKKLEQPALDHLNSGFLQISKLTNRACEKHNRSSKEEHLAKLLGNLNDKK